MVIIKMKYMIDLKLSSQEADDMLVDYEKLTTNYQGYTVR